MIDSVIFAALGLIVGSFLNVLILRHGIAHIGGRSRCMRCGHTLAWFDLIPLVSWIMLRGRCRYCRAPISVQYPLVEGACAGLFALVAGLPVGLDPVYTVLFCVIAALLLAIAVYDLYHTIIPDPWVYAFIALSLCATGSLSVTYGSTPGLFYVLAGPIAASPLFLLWAVSGGRWMGFGDVKLALGMGWLLGPALGIVSVFFAFIIGAVVSVGILMPLPHIARLLRSIGITSLVETLAGFTIGSEASYRRRSLGNETTEKVSFPSARWTMSSEIPFGPFLVSSCLIVWFITGYGIDLSAIPLVGSLWSSFLP